VPEPVPEEPSRVQTEVDRWPGRIFETLQGKLSEAALIEVIRNFEPESERRGLLTEALYYVGELRLAEGDVETARRHFATVINLRVLSFVEYGMARAELKKMRDRKPVATAAAAGASTPGH
jgi:lipoprotein NlpI